MILLLDSISKNINLSEKLKGAFKEKYLKTVSAFANYNDGEIVFGVTDDLNVIGVDNPTEECLNIENQINDSINPFPDDLSIL